MKLLLHIGMPKCGSSALQTFLSSQTFLEHSTKKRLAYISVLNNGTILLGEQLIKIATKSTHGYVSSHSWKDICNFSSRLQKNISSQIRELEKDYDILVLSNEGWGGGIDEKLPSSFIARNDYDVTALMYIRPQIEWINSAWWQWGAWSNLHFKQWVNRNKKMADWNAVAEIWEKQKWIKHLEIRLLPDDIVTDTLSYLGITGIQGLRVNEGLPSSLLRIFQQFRVLRPSPHDSGIEFALKRHLKLESAKAPWVLPLDLVENLIENYRASNQALFLKLSQSQQSKMIEDSKWRDPNAFSSYVVAPATQRNINSDELKQITVAALEAVAELDRKLRNFPN